MSFNAKTDDPGYALGLTVAKYGPQATGEKLSLEAQFKDYKRLNKILFFGGLAITAIGASKNADIRSTYQALHPDTAQVPLDIQLTAMASWFGGAIIAQLGLVRHLVASSNGDTPTSLNYYAPGAVDLRQHLVASLNQTEHLPL